MVRAFQIKRQKADPLYPIEHDPKRISRAEGVFDMAEITCRELASYYRTGCAKATRSSEVSDIFLN